MSLLNNAINRVYCTMYRHQLKYGHPPTENKGLELLASNCVLLSSASTNNRKVWTSITGQTCSYFPELTEKRILYMLQKKASSVDPWLNRLDVCCFCPYLSQTFGYCSSVGGSSAYSVFDCCLMLFDELPRLI